MISFCASILLSRKESAFSSDFLTAFLSLQESVTISSYDAATTPRPEILLRPASERPFSFSAEREKEILSA